MVEVPDRVWQAAKRATGASWTDLLARRRIPSAVACRYAVYLALRAVGAGQKESADAVGLERTTPDRGAYPRIEADKDFAALVDRLTTLAKLSGSKSYRVPACVRELTLHVDFDAQQVEFVDSSGRVVKSV
jgi:hypothetical protein